MLHAKKIFVFGYSGHSYVVLDTALQQGYELGGFFDKETPLNNPFGLLYLGNEQKVDFSEIIQSNYGFPTVGDNNLRKRLVNLFVSQAIHQTVIVSRNAHISRTVEIGPSTFVAPGVVINSLGSIGCGCIINSSAIVEHECVINDYAHVGPGAVLAGNVIVGSGAFVGANSVVKQGVKIGDNAVIGAGSVVLSDVPSNEVWVGSPAKKMGNE